MHGKKKEELSKSRGKTPIDPILGTEEAEGDTPPRGKKKKQERKELRKLSSIAGYKLH